MTNSGVSYFWDPSIVQQGYDNDMVRVGLGNHPPGQLSKEPESRKGKKRQKEKWKASGKQEKGNEKQWSQEAKRQTEGHVKTQWRNEKDKCKKTEKPQAMKSDEKQWKQGTHEKQGSQVTN